VFLGFVASALAVAFSDGKHQNYTFFRLDIGVYKNYLSLVFDIRRVKLIFLGFETLYFNDIFQVSIQKFK
jgi:hypothetical protein